MNEIMLEGAGYFDEPPDYQHDWRIISVGENSWRALCLECGVSTTPDVMNGGVETLEAENDALGQMLSEHVDILAARDRRIGELENELAKSKGYEEGWRLQVEAAKLRLKAAEAELAERDSRSCQNCRRNPCGSYWLEYCSEWEKEEKDE